MGPVGLFDEGLFDHIRMNIHALTVDSAGNEVAAGEAMRSPNSNTAAAVGEEAFAPNLRTIIRDKAHTSRRILQRPWNCDNFLSTISNVLSTDPGSVAQLVSTECGMDRPGVLAPAALLALDEELILLAHYSRMRAKKA